MKKLRYFLTAFLLTVAGVGAAATFNLFQPATGILKGNASTYVTTAAASTDVISLWSGTCDATTFLKGDGSCEAPPPTGVTSVGLTMPSGFNVTGSPITSTGTLAVSTTLNGLIAGTGSGFSTAASSNVISLWTGTCDASTFLRGDGSCQSAGGGGPTLAGNNTWTGTNTFQTSPLLEAASVALQWRNTSGGTNEKVWQWRTFGSDFRLTARNDDGSNPNDAIAIARSGAAISTINLSSSAGVISTATGASYDARRSGDAPYYQMSTTTGTQLGYLQANDSSNKLELANVQSGGNINLLTTGGGEVTVNGTPLPVFSETIGDSISVSGFSSMTNQQMSWTKIGRLVCLNFVLAGTSNATNLSVSGGTWPNPLYNASGMVRVVNAGTGAAGVMAINPSNGDLEFSSSVTLGTFTASGTKSAVGFFCYTSAS